MRCLQTAWHSDSVVLASKGKINYNNMPMPDLVAEISVGKNL